MLEVQLPLKHFSRCLWTKKNSFGSLKMLKKLIFGPQKMEKIDFLQNLDLPDLAKHGRGLPQYPATRSHWPFSWRIQYIKNLLPQWCEEYLNRAKLGWAKIVLRF